MNEEFKKNEGLAKKVMEILINDYLNNDRIGSNIPDIDYFEIIKWSIEDYETCGYNMHEYRTYLNIIKKQNERKENKFGRQN